jgi:phosphatidylinositol dimannoside acyltransferase
VTEGERRPAASSPHERRLEAPHRRGGTSPRVVERLAVLAYKATTRVADVAPAGLAREVVGTIAQGSYLAWPTKRRWSNRNFGHVLGLPPDDPRVRRLALRAYHEYGRYLVELMRLSTRTPDEMAEMVPYIDVDELRRIAAGARGGLIYTVGHVGSNDAVMAAIARHGMPISVVADDSSFPELFELLRQEREARGATVIAWRNLREIYGVLRRREMLALLVDWGYRADGIPVRLFDAWTTLPAGPATLAARTGSRILPVTIRRQPDDTFTLSWPEPIEVASSDPAALQRATQEIADALEVTIGSAPEQWYNFKPIWPATPDESDELERRGGEMQAGRPDPGPGLARASREVADP